MHCNVNYNLQNNKQTTNIKYMQKDEYGMIRAYYEMKITKERNVPSKHPP